MSEQWITGFTKAEHERAKNTLKEHKRKLPKMKCHRINAKTIIQLRDDLTRKEVEKRLKKYQTI